MDRKFINISFLTVLFLFTVFFFPGANISYACTDGDCYPWGCFTNVCPFIGAPCVDPFQSNSCGEAWGTLIQGCSACECDASPPVCCTPTDPNCASRTCTGDTCFDGCKDIPGTKTTGSCAPVCTPTDPNCASRTCTGDTCFDGCNTLSGTKTCACVPSDPLCASDTCIGDSCWNGCEYVTGTKICISCVSNMGDLCGCNNDGRIDCQGVCQGESECVSCGNGTIEGTEQCDLGASNGPCPSTCSASCTNNNCSTQTCGNGVREGSEQCDLGGSNGLCPSTCSTVCTSNGCVTSPFCGNGILESGEQCDTGSNRGSCPKTCSTSCTNNSCGGGGAVCGNGILESGEQCDTGSNRGSCPKTCSTLCTNNSCVVCSCAGKTCGDDGCGHSCGSCGASQTCGGGTCLCSDIEASNQGQPGTCAYIYPITINSFRARPWDSTNFPSQNNIRILKRTSQHELTPPDKGLLFTWSASDGTSVSTGFSCSVSGPGMITLTRSGKNNNDVPGSNLTQAGYQLPFVLNCTNKYGYSSSSTLYVNVLDPSFQEALAPSFNATISRAILENILNMPAAVIGVFF